MGRSNSDPYRHDLCLTAVSDQHDTVGGFCNYRRLPNRTYNWFLEPKGRYITNNAQGTPAWYGNARLFISGPSGHDDSRHNI